MMTIMARAMAWIVSGAILVWPVAAAWLWVAMAPAIAAGMPQLGKAAQFTPTILAAGALLAFVIGCVQSYGLSGARKTLFAVADGNPMSVSAIDGLRRFARVELLMVFLSVLQHTLSILIVTGLQASGEASLSLNIGSHHIGRLALAAVLLFAVEGMARGRSAIEENETFL